MMGVSERVEIEKSVGGAEAAAAHPRQSYAQWYRQIMRDVQAGLKTTALYDSSMAEPIDLLRQTMAGAFGGELTNRYQSAFAGGNPFVIDALAARYQMPPDQILCSTGATGALALIYQTFLKPGDRIIVEAPCFDLFCDRAEAMSVGVDFLHRRGDHFEVDPSDLATLLRPETKLIVLSNLHNPSSSQFDEAALMALDGLASAAGVPILVDEVYADFVLPRHEAPLAARLSPNFISINSLTKVFGLSTLRCGWIIAGPKLLAPIRETMARFETGVSKLAHAVAALVLERPEPYEAQWRERLARNRATLSKYFSAWKERGLMAGAIPPFGCVFFPQLIGIEETLNFSDWLTRHHGVTVVPGDYFGAKGHVRIGFGRPHAELEDGLIRLDEGLKAYRR